MNIDSGEKRGVPFALPFIGKEEEEAVLRVLRSGWITTGPETIAFEREFAEFLATPPGTAEGSPRNSPASCLAVNSATSGLHLALDALDIRPGDVVLAPSYTFTSTAAVVRYLRAEVAFVDVVPGGFHLDPAALENTLDRLSRGLPAYPPRPGTEKEGFGPRGIPRAVIPVHYGGLPCDMGAITAVSGRYGVKVIEDAAHAFPSWISPGGFAGTIGDIGVFSFYATKTLTTGEGGMVVCRDRALAERMSITRSHGIDRSIWNRYTDKRASWYYEVVDLGYKYNMPDILAAIGRVQLGRAMTLLEARRTIARRYDAAFAGEEPLSVPPSGPADARHLYPLRLNPEKVFLSRDAFIKAMREEGIGVSVHFIPLHSMPYYKNRSKLKNEDFPESYKSFQRVISLPIWPGMGDDQIERVIGTVKTMARRAA
ncbi:MAG: DegT/DnrJ/EryC1/StrS family aminotransferase [Spirochaetaceae bacterium]|nr:DegT/DnrJ/EryC1/StrS family aminotransferase [Spirochaetaceae bacterium]